LLYQLRLYQALMVLLSLKLVLLQLNQSLLWRQSHQLIPLSL
jgi:hypothetical protein